MIARWLVVDTALVAVFAAIGRLSHDEGLTLVGWAHTAWPFLAGAALGWVVVELRRRPPGAVTSGVAIWLGAVVGGMLLRRLSDQGTALPFVVVALVVLGGFLVGPRLVRARAVTGSA